MNNTFIASSLAAVALALGSCSSDKNTETEDFNYKVDRFADIEVLRYKVTDFEQLTPKQKELVYYLTEAALYGRDILTDQNGRYNLAIRTILEEIYKNYTGDKESADYKGFVEYLKQVWFANGIYHHYSTDKFTPKFSQDFFVAEVGKLPADKLPLADGQTVEALLAEITPVIFDPTVLPKRVNQIAGQDLIATSANNYYGEGVTQAEVEAFYNAMKVPGDTAPVSYGLNSRLVKKDGKLVEETYKIGGRYGAAIEKIVENLKDHPAVLVWYVSDEEARSRVPDIIRLRNTINAIDPDHPTWTLTCFYDDLNYYATSGDILGIDPYPVMANHGPQSLRELQEALAAGEKTGATVWHVPQAFNWAIVDKNMSDEAFRKSRFLTREEVRTSPLLGAIYGAKGFVFYAYYDITAQEKRAPERGEQDWNNLKETVRLLRDLAPWIMSTEKAPAVTVESTPAGEVCARAFVRDGQLRVVIASLGKSSRAIITVPEGAGLKSRFGKTRDLGGGRYEFTSDAIDSDVLE